MKGNKKIVITLFVAVIFSIMLVIGLQRIRQAPSNCYDEDFMGKLSVSINGNEIGTDTSAWSSINLRKNDIVILSTVMPTDAPNVAAISADIMFCSVEAFLDNHRIYEYGADQGAENILPLGAGLHYVSLPEGYQGKAFSLLIIPSDDFVMSYVIKQISFCEDEMPVTSVIRKNLFSFMVAIFLLISALIVCIIGIGMIAMDLGNAFGLIYLSIFGFSLGLWSLCSTNFIHIFSDDISLNTAMEYFSFYMLVPSCIFVMSYLKSNSIFTKGLTVFKILLSLLYITAAVSSMASLLHYNRFLTAYHIISLAALVYTMVALAYKFQKQPMYEKLLCIGIYIIVLVAIIQGIVYNLSRFIAKQGGFSLDTWVYVMMPIVIAIFIISYVIKYSSQAVTKRELKLLEKMAYEDSLTGLGNRQSGMIKLIEYQKDKQNYFVIVFDVNNLKQTNDKFGHAAGDKLLVCFAECLKSSMPQDSTKLRIGGDEFVVIVPTDDKEVVRKALKALKYHMSVSGSCCTGQSGGIEVAYGIASTCDTPDFDYDKIFSEADKNMYLNKLSLKQIK